MQQNKHQQSLNSSKSLHSLRPVKEGCLMIRSINYQSRSKLSLQDGSHQFDDMDRQSQTPGPMIETFYHQIGAGINRKTKTAESGYVGSFRSQTNALSTTRTDTFHSSSVYNTSKQSFFDPAGTMNGFGQTQSIPLASIQEVNMDQTAGGLNSQDKSEIQQSGYIPDSKVFFENFMRDENYSRVKYDITIPSEDEIRENSRLKLPVIISSQENQHTTQHFLDDFPRGCKLIQGIIESSVQTREDMLQRKEQLKLKIKQIKIKEENQIAKTQKQVSEATQLLQQKIEKDFVQHQTQQFKLNQEITKMVKEKVILEQEIEKALEKIEELENRLYGMQVFQLETNDPNIQNMTLNNLRSQSVTQSIYQNMIN